MIFLIFGDNLPASRKKLLSFNAVNYPDYDIVHQNSTINTEGEFSVQVSSTSFFASKKIIIFENFFKGKENSWKKKINFLSLEKSEDIFVFWEENCTKKVIDCFPKCQVFEFRLPNHLWQFLDAIGEKGKTAKDLIKLQREVLKTVEPELIFLMLARQFRFFILVKSKNEVNPSDWEKLTFQKYKLARCAENFTLNELKNCLFRLLEIDVKLKTGYSDDLVSEMEKFLLSLFETSTK